MSLPQFLADEDLRGTIIRAVRRMKLVSHGVNTIKAFAEQRISDGLGIHGLSLVHEEFGNRPNLKSGEVELFTFRFRINKNGTGSKNDLRPLWSLQRAATQEA